MVGHEPGVSPSTPLSVDYPPATQDLHHEVELVVALAHGGSNLSENEAMSKVFGYAVGLDLTRRDLQDQAKDKRRPWTSAKMFASSAPCSPVVPLEDIGPSHPTEGRIWLTVDGEVKQDSDIVRVYGHLHTRLACL